MVILAIVLFFTTFAAAQVSPPNDNFANRIFLTGNNLLFDGTLNGATRESDPHEIVFGHFQTFPNRTVWWEWTTHEPTTVIIEIKNLSKAVPLRGFGVGVYDLVDIGNGTVIEGYFINTRWPKMFLTFQAMPGTNYQIQLAGNQDFSCSFELTATNLPYILEQPKHQAVTANDSVMFGIVATGLKPFGFQWQRSGTNLPGETGASLSLENVATDSVGAYCVIITNSVGTTISDAANLIVSTTDSGGEIFFAQASNTQFVFKVSGDVERRYRVESSADLNNWSHQTSFPSPHFYDAYQSTIPMRSVISDMTGNDSFIVPQVGMQKFYRLSSFHAVNEVCNNNLKKIRFAQLLHGYEDTLNNHPDQSVTVQDISPYLKNGKFPTCPSNGLYELTQVLRNPRCSLANHIFEER